jgi:hypothetical protein
MKPEKYLLPLLPGADHRKKGWHTGKDKGILSAEIDYLVQVRHAGTGSGKDLVSSSPFYFFSGYRIAQMSDVKEYQARWCGY